MRYSSASIFRSYIPFLFHSAILTLRKSHGNSQHKPQKYALCSSQHLKIAHPFSHILTHLPPFFLQPSHPPSWKNPHVSQLPPQGVILERSVAIVSALQFFYPVTQICRVLKIKQLCRLFHLCCIACDQLFAFAARQFFYF